MSAGAQPQPGQISCMIFRGVEPTTGMPLYALPSTGGESTCMAVPLHGPYICGSSPDAL